MLDVCIITDSQVRGGHRSTATRLVAKLVEIDANVNPVLVKEYQLYEFEEKKKALVAQLSLIEALDVKILSLSKDDKEYETLNNAIQDVNDEYNSAIHSVIAPTHSRASNLAKFDLPEFSGDILLWL